VSADEHRAERNHRGRRNGRGRSRNGVKREDTTAAPEPLPDFLSEILRLLGGEPTAPPPGTARAKKQSAQTPVGTSEMLQFLGQAGLAYLASGFRYWSRMADAWAKTLPSVTRAAAAGRASGTSAEDRAVFIDELRARLRDLVDIPAQEARLLQTELDRIATELWPRSQEKGEAQYWRRWETKP
jgi:hypothetical protein